MFSVNTSSCLVFNDSQERKARKEVKNKKNEVQTDLQIKEEFNKLLKQNLNMDRISSKAIEEYKKKAFEFGDKDHFKDQVSILKNAEKTINKINGLNTINIEKVKGNEKNLKKIRCRIENIAVQAGVCKKFIEEKESAYKGSFRKIFLAIDRIFKALGFKTDQDDITEAKALVDRIEIYLCGENKPTEKYFDLGKTEKIKDKKSLVAALKKMPAINYAENNYIFEQIQFPSTNDSQPLQSTVIKLEDVAIKDKNGIRILGKDLLLMRDSNNHWYAYYETDVLGTGSAKKVYLGWDLSLEKQVAFAVPKPGSKRHPIKSIKKEAQTFLENEFQTEENIAQTHTLFVLKNRSSKEPSSEPQNKTVCLVQDYYRETLQSFLYRRPKEKNYHYFKQRINIIDDVIKGVFSLHQKNIIHRDLKPENIFLNNDLKAFIGDLDLSSPVTNATNRCGTPTYHSPEEAKKRIAKNTQDAATKKDDIWSLGLMIYQMFYKKSLYKIEKAEITNRVNKDSTVKDKQREINNELIKQISEIEENFYKTKIVKSSLKVKGDYKFSKLDNDINFLLRNMLCVDPAKRYNIEQVLAKWEDIKADFQKLAINS